MGFEITGNEGILGAVAVVLLIGAGFIVVTWLLAAARQDRRDALEDEQDRSELDA